MDRHHQHTARRRRHDVKIGHHLRQIAKARQQPDIKDRAPHRSAQRRLGVEGGGALAVVREQTPGQPKGRINRYDQRQDRPDQRLAILPQQARKGECCSQKADPHDRQDQLPQRDDEPKHGAPPAAVAVKKPFAHTRHKRTPAHHHDQPDQKHAEDGRGVVGNRGAHLRIAQPRGGLAAQGRGQIGKCCQRCGPVDRVDRGRLQLKQFLRLALGQDRVDLGNQAIGAVERLVRGQARQLRLFQSGLQRGAPGRDGVGLGPAVLGRGSKPVDLRLDGVDPLGIGGFRSQELRPPTHQFGAAALEKGGRGNAPGDQVFRRRRRGFPCVVINLGRGCGGAGLRQRRHRQPDKRHRQRKRQAQRRKETSKMGHQASNTAGTSRPGPSIHGGTGRPFSRRKSGLKSLP